MLCPISSMRTQTRESTSLFVRVGVSNVTLHTEA